MPKINFKISIIGAGRVGSAISSLLYDKGISTISIIDNNIRAAEYLGKIVKCKKISSDISDLAPETDILFITTPDDVIFTVAAAAAKNKNLNFKNLIAIHTSGVHTTDIFEPLKIKGVLPLSFHPIQTFPKNKPLKNLKKSFPNIYFGVEGTEKAIKFAKKLASLLGGKVIIVKKDLKPLYHIASVFISNYILSLLNATVEISSIFRSKKDWSEIFLPILTTTIQNSIKTSPQESLTGPIERGDFETVKLHINSLKKIAPELINFYNCMALETARIAYKKGSLSTNQYRKLKDFIKTRNK